MKAGLPPRPRINLRPKGLVNYKITVQDLRLKMEIKPSQTGTQHMRINTNVSECLPGSYCNPRWSKSKTADSSANYIEAVVKRQKLHSIDDSRISTMGDTTKRGFSPLDTGFSFGRPRADSRKMVIIKASKFHLEDSYEDHKNYPKETSRTLQSRTKTALLSKIPIKKPSVPYLSNQSHFGKERDSSRSSQRSRLNKAILSRESTSKEKSKKALLMAKKIFSQDELRRLGYIANDKTRSQFVKNCHGRIV